MSDTNLSPPPPPPAPPPAPWHAGVDAETLGHWQNKGWKVDDPKEIAIAATKQAREAEKFFGVPPDQIVKMPKADAKPEDIKAFRMRLGMPGDPKEYDFSGVKDIAQPLADTLRTAAFNAGLPKDAATAIASAVQKHTEDQAKNDKILKESAIQAAMDDLRKSWGPHLELNASTANRAISRLGELSGLTPQQTSDAIQALNQAGFGRAEIMKMMHFVGTKWSEDKFIESGGGGGGNGMPTSREGAIARKADLMRDEAWVARYLKNGAAEVQLMTALNIMESGGAA